MNQITIAQVKPGDKPHITWQGELLADNGEWLAALARPGITVQHHSRNLVYTLPHYCVSLFSSKEYFNVMLDFHTTGEFMKAYINVAAPATWGSGELRALDLDLDVVVSPDGVPTLLDEDEFEASIAAGAYSEQTILTARTTAEQLMRISKHNTFPFLRDNLEGTLKSVAAAIF